MTLLASVNTVGMQEKELGDPVSWFCVVLSTVICLMPIFAEGAYTTFYWTRVSTLCTELQKKHAKALGLSDGPICGCSDESVDDSNVYEYGRDEPSGKVVELSSFTSTKKNDLPT